MATNPRPLNVIALISGGKDSFFSILHCLANGHKIIALANLHPPQSEDGATPDDIDSFMYQTIGHNIIPLYAEALGLPLYRQEIRGGAVRTERDYGFAGRGPILDSTNSKPFVESEADETEDLVPLLRRIKDAHPEANAVSTGAILSTYQRTRVESVALRLGLVPLSFLWQYPFLPPYQQSQLLFDMVAIGLDARIIKTASGGLDESFIWSNVADPKTVMRLQKAMGRFGEADVGAVLGEGGEFETLLVDGPNLLKRLQVEDGDWTTISSAGNSIWKSTRSSLVSKESTDDTALERLRKPNLWDTEFYNVLETLLNLPNVLPRPQSEVQSSWQGTPFMSEFDRDQISSTPSTIVIPNLTSRRDRDPNKPDDPGIQMQFILGHLATQIIIYKEDSDINLDSIVHITLLLRDMSSFAEVNNVYFQLLNIANPPSRVTVACGNALPEGVDVMLSAVVSRTRKEGLHVQSRSYWAPANIGPYSQANSIPLSPPSSSSESEDRTRARAVYVAGQIPLVPASMDMYITDGFKGQTALALQHLWRIGRATNVQWWTAGVAYISSAILTCSTEEAVQAAQTAWKEIHNSSLKSTDLEDNEEENDIDPWDAKNLAGQWNDKVPRSLLPDPEVVKGEATQPPCFVVQVSSLPRGADIEFHSTGLAHLPSRSLISTKHRETPLFYTASIPSSMTLFLATEITEKGHTGHDFRIWSGMGKRERMVWEHVTLYAGPELPKEWANVLPGVQWVPCKHVWGSDGREVAGVLLGRVSIKDDGNGDWDGGLVG